MNPDEPTTEYDRPVAYDVDGQPLYAHPAKVVAEPQPVTQPSEVQPSRPAAPTVDIATHAKHQKATELYPTLNLSEDEYVISEIRRHPVGLLLPLALGIILAALALSALFNYDIVVQLFHLTGSLADVSFAAVPLLLFILLVFLGTYIAYVVYTGNRFYLTNESVIQDIQLGLFNHRQQSISLGSVEDASYTQNGLIQQMLGYGTIRLSTVGDENTYTFIYVAQPGEHIAELNDAVESFKNGRLVDRS